MYTKASPFFSPWSNKRGYTAHGHRLGFYTKARRLGLSLSRTERKRLKRSPLSRKLSGVLKNTSGSISNLPNVECTAATQDGLKASEEESLMAVFWTRFISSTKIVVVTSSCDRTAA